MSKDVKTALTVSAALGILAAGWFFFLQPMLNPPMADDTANSQADAPMRDPSIGKSYITLEPDFVNSKYLEPGMVKSRVYL
jgi:hypothetical protein